MHTCSKCLLSDSIPSVKIENGVCGLCSSHYSSGEGSFFNEAQQLSGLIKENRDKKYQIILAYSGGKDSTYTLKLLSEKFDASILALTFDNGFLSESCFNNIRAVTDCLGIDSVIVKYPAEKMIKAFKYIEDGKGISRQSLERASAICNLCIMLIKNMIYYEAIIRNISIICFGWTPGQTGTDKPLIRLNHQMLLKGFGVMKNLIVNKLGDAYNKYFLDEKFMETNKDGMPYLYYPFVNNPYNEEELIESIKKIGWLPPENTDGNSTNCLLNSYANNSHLKNFGFHPYAFEISNLIREGYLSREEGLKKLSNATNNDSYQLVCEKFRNIS